MGKAARILPPIGIAIVLTLAAILAGVTVIFFRTADTLPEAVRVVMTPVVAAGTGLQFDADETGEGLDLLIVCGPPTAAARGMQFALLIVLFGGMPAAVFGVALVRLLRVAPRYQSERWLALSTVGFVFQLSNLAMTSMLLVGSAVFFSDAGVEFVEFLGWGAPLGLNLLFAVPGLRAWHALNLSSADRRTPIGLCLR